MDVVSRFVITLLTISSFCWQANASDLFEGESRISFLPLQKGVPHNEALQVVAKAAVGRKWSLIDVNDEFVTINLKHHGYDAMLRFFVADNQLFYLDASVRSSNRFSSEDYSGPGDDLERANAPKRWIEYLRRDTRKSLSNLARMNAVKAEGNEEMDTKTLKSKLITLKSMFDEGLIDESEYQAKKDEILSQF